MAARESRARSSRKRESAFRSLTEAIQLENIVRRAHQRPFPLHLLEPTQQELPETTGLLDLANHRFDDPFAGRVNRRAGLRVQLAGHPVDDRGSLWEGTTRTGSRPLTCFCFRVEMYASMAVSAIAAKFTSEQ